MPETRDECRERARDAVTNDTLRSNKKIALALTRLAARIVRSGPTSKSTCSRLEESRGLEE